MQMSQAEFDAIVSDIETHLEVTEKEYHTLLALIRGCDSLQESFTASHLLSEMFRMDASSNLFALGIIFGKSLAVREALATIPER